MIDIDTREALDSALEDWGNGRGRLIAKRHVPRMGATFAIYERKGGGFDILRAFPLGGVPQVSVDAHDSTAAEAFTILINVIH